MTVEDEPLTDITGFPLRYSDLLSQYTEELHHRKLSGSGCAGNHARVVSAKFQLQKLELVKFDVSIRAEKNNLNDLQGGVGVFSPGEKYRSLSYRLDRRKILAKSTEGSEEKFLIFLIRIRFSR